MGWCDDPMSKKYNKLIRFPFSGSAEKLFLKKNIYDIILIINFNLKPVIKNKGSAIFLHISKKNYEPTNGCIAVSLQDMKLLLSKVLTFASSFFLLNPYVLLLMQSKIKRKVSNEKDSIFFINSSL